MMRQVLQNYRLGEVKVDEVPAPALRSGAVLVANRFSLIGAVAESLLPKLKCSESFSNPCGQFLLQEESRGGE